MLRILIGGILLVALNAWGNVYISEISLVPSRSDGAVMVELCNAGGIPQPVSGWRLVDSSGNTFVIPEGIELQPRQFLVVVFGPVPEDVCGDAIWLPCSESWSGQAFADEFLEECALYAGPEANPDTLRDYVQWGHVSYLADKEESRSRQWAIGKGLWAEGRLVRTVFPDAVAGRSLGRVIQDKMIVDGLQTYPAMNRWLIYQNDEIGFGERNPLPKPRIGNACFMGQFITKYHYLLIGWSGVRYQDGIFRVQVSRDPAFREWVCEEEVFSGLSAGLRELPEGHYFWRVRAESPDEIGEWSAVYPLVVLFRVSLKEFKFPWA